MKINIYDIDGTLVDSSHRYSSVEGVFNLKHWRDNEHKGMQDKLLPLAEAYKKDLACPNTITVLATARACKKGDLTYQYIKTRLGMPDHFIHRLGNDDNRGGARLKIEGIEALNLPKGNITFFEDNRAYLKEVCQAIHAVGVYVPSNQGD